MLPGTDPLLEWSADGLLPGNDPSKPVSRIRSPYRVSLLDFVQRFGFTGERRRLLRAFLSYRGRLHSSGIVAGFQWVDGSFVEDVERTREKDPGDIDVVNFMHVPGVGGEEQFYEQHRDLFDRFTLRHDYDVDAYNVAMDPLEPATVDFAINNAVYWYSVWSHTEDSTWKGYIQLSLDVADDGLAQEWLDVWQAEDNHGCD